MSKFLSTCTYSPDAESTWARLVNKTDEIHFLVEFYYGGLRQKQDKYENDVVC